MADPMLLTVVVASGSGARCVDLAVAADVALEDLLPELLRACGLDADGMWSVMDGARELRLAGLGLAGQGVVSGSVLRLEPRP